MSALRKAGSWVAVATFMLMIAYAAVTIAGFVSLAEPDAPIRDPYFTTMEMLILLLAPTLVLLMVVIRERAEPERMLAATAALVFVAMAATITSAVHFSVLTLGRQPAFAEAEELFAFRWPSLAYALDILAWDIFFALSAFFAALVFRGPGLSRWVRWTFLMSALLSALGLLGVATGNMQLRNIGIAGYAGVFPIGVACLALLWRRGERGA